MSVVFVIGPPCAGKSYFIKNNFKNYEIIDLYDFQKDIPFITAQEVLISYEKAKDALVKAIKEGKDVVLEHTLLKAKRRIPYIEAVREVYGGHLECFAIIPNEETYLRRCKERGVSEYSGKVNYSIYEEPQKEEGFDEVYIIKE
jgi:predicted kinase